MREEVKQLSKSEQKKDDWMNSKWRPAMGWMYMAVCVADFILFPILWSIIQALDGDGKVEAQWNPLTLQGAGLFHMAMGAVLGIAAFGRTQEKLAITNNTSQPTVSNNRQMESTRPPSQRSQGSYYDTNQYNYARQDYDEPPMPPIKPIIRRPE